MARTWTLHDLLDHETGDSWNGTHFREIKVEFNDKAQTVKVSSINEMFEHDVSSLELPVADVKAQLASGQLDDARYFGSFAVEAAKTVPGIEVEGVTSGFFSDHVKKVTVKP